VWTETETCCLDEVLIDLVQVQDMGLVAFENMIHIGCTPRDQEALHAISTAMDFGYGNTNVVAVLIPLSEDARRSVDQGTNAQYADWTDNVLPEGLLARTHQRLIKLSFAAFAGRRSFTFGSSRIKHYQLPLSSTALVDISELHFTLFIHEADGTLWVRNASLHGTRIRAASIDEGPSVDLQRVAMQVSQVTLLQLGRNDRLGFLLIPNRPRHLQSYQQHITRHFQSIVRPSCALTSTRKRLASTMLGLETLRKRPCISTQSIDCVPAKLGLCTTGVSLDDTQIQVYGYLDPNGHR